MTHRAFVSLAVERHEQPDVIIEEQVQVAVHPLRVAAVTDDAVAVVVLLVETQQHAIQRRHHGGRAGVHLLGGLGFQDSFAVEFAVLQMRDHEFRHVRCGRGETARGRRHHIFIRFRRLTRDLVAVACQREQLRRQGLTEARMSHAERLEDVLFNVTVEALT